MKYVTMLKSEDYELRPPDSTGIRERGYEKTITVNP
jgi:hypothetical protein